MQLLSQPKQMNSTQTNRIQLKPPQPNPTETGQNLQLNSALPYEIQTYHPKPALLNPNQPFSTNKPFSNQPTQFRPIAFYPPQTNPFKAPRFPENIATLALQISHKYSRPISSDMKRI